MWKLKTGYVGENIVSKKQFLNKLFENYLRIKTLIIKSL